MENEKNIPIISDIDIDLDGHKVAINVKEAEEKKNICNVCDKEVIFPNEQYRKGGPFCYGHALLELTKEGPIQMDENDFMIGKRYFTGIDSDTVFYFKKV